MSAGRKREENPLLRRTRGDGTRIGGGRRFQSTTRLVRCFTCSLRSLSLCPVQQQLILFLNSLTLTKDEICCWPFSETWPLYSVQLLVSPDIFLKIRRDDVTHTPWRIADPNYVSIILSKFIIRGERSSLTFSYFDDSQRIGFGVGWHVYILLLGETYLAYLGVCWQSQQCWRSLIGCRLNKPRLAVLRYKSVVVAPRFVSLTVPGTSLSILFLYLYIYTCPWYFWTADLILCFLKKWRSVYR